MRLRRTVMQRDAERDYEAEKSQIIEGYNEYIGTMDSFAQEVMQSDMSSGEKTERLRAIQQDILRTQEECASVYNEIIAAQEEIYTSSMQYGVEENHPLGAADQIQTSKYGVEADYAKSNEQLNDVNREIENNNENGENYQADGLNTSESTHDYGCE